MQVMYQPRRPAHGRFIGCRVDTGPGAAARPRDVAFAVLRLAGLYDSLSKTWTGSTRLVRRDGIQHAAAPTSMNPAAALMSVAGSRARDPQ